VLRILTSVVLVTLSLSACGDQPRAVPADIATATAGELADRFSIQPTEMEDLATIAEENGWTIGEAAYQTTFAGVAILGDVGPRSVYVAFIGAVPDEVQSDVRLIGLEVDFRSGAPVSETELAAQTTSVHYAIREAGFDEVSPGPDLETGTVQGPGTFPLVRLDDVTIRGGSFEVSGTLSHIDVVGDAYLEMWVHFADDSYFSRTVADSGPQGVISGTSSDRPFLLAFEYGDTAPPTALEINVVLPGPGEVTVGPLIISAAAGDQETWVGRGAAGMFGAVAGTALGLAGAFIGITGGRGRARRGGCTGTGLGRKQCWSAWLAHRAASNHGPSFRRSLDRTHIKNATGVRGARPSPDQRNGRVARPRVSPSPRGSETETASCGRAVGW